MNKRKILSTLFVAVFVAAGVTAIAAQGRYVNVYSRADVDGFIRDLENSSDVFSRDFKNTGGTSTAERRNVDRFENAVDRLRRTFNNNNTWWNSRNDVQQMMGEARSVNVMMNNDRYGRPLESQWRNLRRDINKLADTYDLPDLAGQGGGGNGGGWGGGGGQGGGQTSRPPTWAQGTFYATSGPNISMSIDANGQIVLTNNGRTYYGRYNRGSMYLNNDVSTVARSGNGISTYNRSTGQTTYYTRDGYAGGGGGEGGPTSRPPNWAVGTFRSVNGNIEMSIYANGNIQLFNAGIAYNGRYYNGQIYLNNDVSTLSRLNNNRIRTYNQSTGQSTDYRRQ